MVVHRGQTEVYTSVWTVHHDAANFDRPYDFRPERWLDPKSKDTKEASQPFSVGPRGCIGRKYAFYGAFHTFCLFFLFFLVVQTLANFWDLHPTSSFAYMEMSLILAKLFFTFEPNLLDKNLDWEGQSRMHVQWWKPELKVRFTERRHPKVAFS